jgi:hypothetical protein
VDKDSEQGQESRQDKIWLGDIEEGLLRASEVGGLTQLGADGMGELGKRHLYCVNPPLGGKATSNLLTSDCPGTASSSGPVTGLLLPQGRGLCEAQSQGASSARASDFQEPQTHSVSLHCDCARAFAREMRL